MIQKSMAMSGTTANYTLAESLRNMLSNKMFQVFIALLCAALFSSIALAGGDDGALGEIWTQLSEALSGAPGKAPGRMYADLCILLLHRPSEPGFGTRFIPDDDDFG